MKTKLQNHCFSPECAAHFHANAEREGNRNINAEKGNEKTASLLRLATAAFQKHTELLFATNSQFLRAGLLDE
jgi:hypothetical protein